MLYLHNILNGIWAIEPSFAQSFIPLITAWIKSGIPPNQNPQQSQQSQQSHPQNIAILSISGVITKHDQFCGPEGMATQSNHLKQCYAAQNVKGIVLKIDSGGGEGNASRLITETIAARNKPVVAFCDDFACSAAYDIAASADHIVANAATARIGSIGTYLTIVDFSEQLKSEGVNLIEIYAEQSKDKNRDYYEALSGNHAPLKAVVNRYNDAFLARIRQNRPQAIATEQEWNTGKLFFADQALSLGLIDAIDTFDNVLNYFS